MKKVVFSIIFILMLLTVANVAYADYGIPGGVEYEAVITNEDGAEATYYGTSLSVIPYGAIVTVQLEYDGEAEVQYNDTWYTISIDDIEPVSESADLLETVEGLYKNMYVWREGTYLYKGPSTLYGKLDENIEIPVGTLIKVMDCSDTWGYVEYDGYEGWIYIYTTSKENDTYDMASGVADILNKYQSHYYTLDEITLSITPGGDEIAGTIPAGEYINSYYYVDSHSHYKTVYIEYEDIKGWYNVYDLSAVCYDYSDFDLSVFISEETEVYSDFDYGDYEISEKIGTIPAKAECKILYETVGENISYAYVEYDGIEGWVENFSGDYTIYLGLDYGMYKIKLTEDLNKIDVDTLEELEEVFETGTEAIIKHYVQLDGNMYGYIQTEDNEGWVLLVEYSDYTKISENYEQIDPTYEDVVESYTDISQFVIEDATGLKSAEVVTVDDEDQDEETSTKVSKKSNSVFEDYLVYCVIGAVAIFIIAIIIIIAINKNKKKNKKEE